MVFFQRIYFISNIKMSEVKKVRAILEDELVNGVVIKKWEVFETELADYLLNNYSNRRELVEEDEAKDDKLNAKINSLPSKAYGPSGHWADFLSASPHTLFGNRTKSVQVLAVLTGSIWQDNRGIWKTPCKPLLPTKEHSRSQYCSEYAPCELPSLTSSIWCRRRFGPRLPLSHFSSYPQGTSFCPRWCQYYSFQSVSSS